MGEFYGFAVYKVMTPHTMERNKNHRFKTTEPERWPVCDTDSEEFIAKLRSMGQAHFVVDRQLPEIRNPRMLVSDYEYVCTYIEYCSEKSIVAHLYAYAENREDFCSHPWFRNATFLGYDCVSDISFDSYLYWDHPTSSEMEKHGFQVNAYGYFLTKAEAARYGQLRRTYLENGACIEDMGIEKAVAVVTISIK